jgi:endoglucanase
MKTHKTIKYPNIEQKKLLHFSVLRFNIFLLNLFLFISAQTFAQNVASRRAATMGLGVNLSYLENYWNGTASLHYGNHVKTTEVAKRKQMLADMASQGIKTVRIPVCFSAWATVSEPFLWDYPQNFASLDSLLKWTLANNMRAIIDLHHPEMDSKTFPTAANLKRVNWLWSEIATRYKNTDPDRVFLELWNEPHDIKAVEWEATANTLLQTIRQICPNHTLIVGAQDWNGIDALNNSQPYTDPNIIYTFHCYDPFVFTHQGASWAGMTDLKGVYYPYNGSTPAIPASIKGTWIEGAVNNYKNDGTKEALVKQLTKAKNWGVRNKVPVFCGEFGSYNEFADEVSRCNHAFTMFSTLGILDIPCAFWEWDGGFNLFKRGSTSTLSDCAKEAMGLYTLRKEALGIENATNWGLLVTPNPTIETLTMQSEVEIDNVEIIDLTGRHVMSKKNTNNQISISDLPSGLYILKAFDKQSKLIGFRKVIKM